MFDLLGQTLNFEVGVWTSMFDLLGQTWMDIRSRSWDVNVRCPFPPAPATHYLFSFFRFFLFLYFFPRQTSKPDFKVPTSTVGTLKSRFKVFSPSPFPPPATATHFFFFYFFVFCSSFFCFVFHAKLRSLTSKFQLRTSEL